jgi:hypothetical protein
MAVASGNVEFKNAIVLGVNSATVRLNNLPTLVVSRSTAEPVIKPISFAGNIQVVNFIAGVFANLQSATLSVNTTYLFVNTGSGNVPMFLDNGGQINGQVGPYNLVPGTAIEFQWDGANLN